MFAVLTSWALLAATEPRWTFCIAEAGENVWITSLIALQADREKLEAKFAAFLRQRGVAKPAPQCPAPQPDKEAAFNAQFGAAEFHRKLGHTLHAVDWPPRRP